MKITPVSSMLEIARTCLNKIGDEVESTYDPAGERVLRHSDDADYLSLVNQLREEFVVVSDSLTALESVVDKLNRREDTGS